jgi:catechol 2,3-dioxygenase-like lactoylglutathione lyase family enzyme
MIRGLHGLFYSSDAAATRAFMRDALGLPYSDVGDGWLIFDLPEGDVGVHPVDRGEPPANTHDVSFYCDDIHGTVADLRARGVTFKCEPQDHGYGWVTYFTMPGGVEVQLYEPRYEKRRAAAPARPAAKQPAARKPAARKPAARKPAARKPATRKPATRKPAARKPAKR